MDNFSEKRENLGAAPAAEKGKRTHIVDQKYQKMNNIERREREEEKLPREKSFRERDDLWR